MGQGRGRDAGGRGKSRGGDGAGQGRGRGAGGRDESRGGDRVGQEKRCRGYMFKQLHFVPDYFPTTHQKRCKSFINIRLT